MKDSNSLGQLLVRVNLINEDQLKYAEDEVYSWCPDAECHQETYW